ncbi:MAG: carbon-nitrogen family hydrolase [Ignavibacteria bacterium]|nr:carbon-nitrogen family hydrolase [Ignavibacteria bacterium]
MKLALVQYNPEWENKLVNQKKITGLINSLFEPADMFIFPEMTLTGFSMNGQLAEIFDKSKSETLDYFSNLSEQFSTNIIAGFIEKDEDKFYNTLFVIDRKGDVIGKYRKIHLFSFAGEEKTYQAGSKVEIVEIEGIKIGLSICYDLRFPELFRIYGKNRVELIVNIANWPEKRVEHFVHLLRARAIENQCFVVGVNRVGWGKKDFYDGRSSIFDPMGQELVSVVNEEKIILAEINLNLVEETRRKFPFLNDIKLI